MLSLSGIILGVINIAIYAAILILIGLVILWFCSWFNFDVPAQVQKIYVLIVALICLYLLVSLLFGIPVPGPISISR